jgi:ankyrin repeat protein
MSDDDEGINPLHEAAQEGDLATVQTLIEGDFGVNAREKGHDSMNWTPLHSASRGGHASVVQYLLSNGADVNDAKASGGKTPLILAAYAGSLDVVKLLVAHGANVLHVDKNGLDCVTGGEQGSEAVAFLKQRQREAQQSQPQ